MTRKVLLLRPHELQGLVSMKEAIDIVEQGYREARSYPAISAPRRRVHSPSGVRVSNFPGGIHGLGVIGTGERPDKLNKGGGNQTKELRGNPVHLVHNSNNGQLLSIMIGEIDEKADEAFGGHACPRKCGNSVGGKQNEGRGQRRAFTGLL